MHLIPPGGDNKGQSLQNIHRYKDCECPACRSIHIETFAGVTCDWLIQVIDRYLPTDMSVVSTTDKHMSTTSDRLAELT
jgi:hypothetical protein